MLRLAPEVPKSDSPLLTQALWRRGCGARRHNPLLTRRRATRTWSKPWTRPQEANYLFRHAITRHLGRRSLFIFITVRNVCFDYKVLFQFVQVQVLQEPRRRPLPPLPGFLLAKLLCFADPSHGPFSGHAVGACSPVLPLVSHNTALAVPPLPAQSTPRKAPLPQQTCSGKAIARAVGMCSCTGDTNTTCEARSPAACSSFWPNVARPFDRTDTFN